MKKNFRNKFISIFAGMTLLAFAAVGMKPQEVQAQQYVWTCYVQSPFDTFYWSHVSRNVAANMAMRLCQEHTPYGSICVARGCE